MTEGQKVGLASPVSHDSYSSHSVLQKIEHSTGVIESERKLSESVEGPGSLPGGRDLGLDS